jgi:hypothetical protein
VSDDIRDRGVTFKARIDQVVARLDPESSVQRGQEVDLWVDATKLHFFHPEGGRNLAE